VLDYDVLIKKVFEVYNEKIDEFVTELDELEIES
jgi:hypothetical protein